MSRALLNIILHLRIKVSLLWNQICQKKYISKGKYWVICAMSDGQTANYTNGLAPNFSYFFFNTDGIFFQSSGTALSVSCKIECVHTEET